MASIVLVLGLQNVSIASDLWVSQKADKGFIGTSDSCVVVTFINGQVYAPTKPVKRDEAAKQYAWKVRNGSEQAGCDEIKQAAKPVKVWKVAVNRDYLTRSVKDILTWQTVKGVRVPVGAICGKEVRPYNSRYSYREVTVDGKIYAVICE